MKVRFWIPWESLSAWRHPGWQPLLGVPQRMSSGPSPPRAGCFTEPGVSEQAVVGAHEP